MEPPDNLCVNGRRRGNGGSGGKLRGSVQSAIRAAVYPLSVCSATPNAALGGESIRMGEFYSRQLLSAVTPLTGGWPHPSGASGADYQTTSADSAGPNRILI